MSATNAFHHLMDDESDANSVGTQEESIHSGDNTEQFLTANYQESVSSWRTDEGGSLGPSPSSTMFSTSSIPPWNNMSTFDDVSLSEESVACATREKNPLHPPSNNTLKLPHSLQDALTYSFDVIDVKLRLKKYSEAVQESDFVIDQLLQVLDSAQYLVFTTPIKKWLKKAFVVTMDCCLELKDMAKAERTALLFNREFKDYEHSFTSLAYIQRKRNDFREAVDTCNEGLQKFPSSQLMYTLRAKCHFSLRHFVLSRKDFNRAIDIYHWHNHDSDFEDSIRPWLKQLRKRKIK